MEQVKKEPYTAQLHPDLIKEVDIARGPKAWNRSRFAEEAFKMLLEKLEKNG